MCVCIVCVCVCVYMYACVDVLVCAAVSCEKAMVQFSHALMFECRLCQNYNDHDLNNTLLHNLS